MVRLNLKWNPHIVVAIILTPAIINMGANILAAHLFIFYSAMISGIIPPMAIPAYAAGIAGVRAVAILLQRRGAARVQLVLPTVLGSKKRSNSQ